MRNHTPVSNWDLWTTAIQEPSNLTDPEKKVGMDWPHPQEARQQHHQAGSDLESTGEEKEGKTQEHRAQRQRGVTVSTSTFLACHQRYCASSSLA